MRYARCLIALVIRGKAHIVRRRYEAGVFSRIWVIHLERVLRESRVIGWDLQTLERIGTVFIGDCRIDQLTARIVQLNLSSRDARFCV